MFLQKLNALFSAPVAVTRPDARAAVAELLVHASMIDGKLDDSEAKARDRLLKDKFGLSDSELESMVADAEAEYEDAIDFYRFTTKRAACPCPFYAVVQVVFAGGWKTCICGNVKHNDTVSHFYGLVCT